MKDRIPGLTIALLVGLVGVAAPAPLPAVCCGPTCGGPIGGICAECTRMEDDCGFGACTLFDGDPAVSAGALTANASARQAIDRADADASGSIEPVEVETDLVYEPLEPFVEQRIAARAAPGEVQQAAAGYWTGSPIEAAEPLPMPTLADDPNPVRKPRGHSGRSKDRR